MCLTHKCDLSDDGWMDGVEEHLISFNSSSTSSKVWLTQFKTLWLHFSKFVREQINKLSWSLNNAL